MTSSELQLTTDQEQLSTDQTSLSEAESALDERSGARVSRPARARRRPRNSSTGNSSNGSSSTGNSSNSGSNRRILRRRERDDRRRGNHRQRRPRWPIRDRPLSRDPRVSWPPRQRLSTRPSTPVGSDVLQVRVRHDRFLWRPRRRRRPSRGRLRSVSASITGLEPDTNYIFRLVANNSLGSSTGLGSPSPPQRAHVSPNSR